MADHPRRRGRNRPDSRAMWDESDRHGRYEDRRDNRNRYRDSRPRSRDRRYRSRSRSPVGERRDQHRSRSRDRRERERDYSTERRRGHETAQTTRDRTDGRHHERERDADRARERERDRDGRRRDDGPDEHTMPKGRLRRSNPRRSVSPPRSPLGKIGRANHDPNSPLPTRTKNRDGDSGRSSVRGDPDDDNRSRKGNASRNDDTRDNPDAEDRHGRRTTRENDSGEDAMEEDDLAVEDDEMSAMQAMMGFGGFGTTKNQKVAGNNAGAVYKAKKTEYRQYMNRIGGFNRPLSPGR
ncbi:hypothetical protein F4678DRAFT_6578 [Xylaria arbuscula]|nr:hypothetical protein F4678DRAFT_6578 [Xylaria arbuscula]